MRSANFIIGAFLALVAFVVILMTYFTVSPSEVAVVTNFGKISYVAGPGLHFKMPFVNNTETFQTSIQEVKPSHGVNTYTVDNQEVDVTFVVFYRVPVAEVAYIYANVPDYSSRLFSMAVDRLKSQMGKVNVSSVAEKRGDLRDAIKATLATDAKTLHLEVTDLQLVDMQYTDTYREAIGKAATAKAGVEAYEYQRQQAEKQAQTAAVTAEGMANAQRAQAKGAADATLFQAQADAKSIELKGTATAQAIKAQADALSANPHLVDLHKADRWDGVLPTAVYAGAPIPFLSVDAPTAKGQ